MKNILLTALSMALCLTFYGCTPADSEPVALPTEASSKAPVSDTLNTIILAEQLEREGRHQEAMYILRELLLLEVPPEPVDEADSPAPTETNLQPFEIPSQTPPASSDSAVPAGSYPGDHMIGKWKSLSGQILWEFQQDGRVTIREMDPQTQSMQPTKAFPYIFDGARVEIQGVLYALSVNDQGLEKLTAPDGSISFVREEDFDQAVMDVPVTMDNWQTYFTLRAANDITLDSDGTIIELRPGFGLFLNDAYVSRYIDGDVSFICTFQKIDMNYQWQTGTQVYRFERIGPYLLDDGSHYDCRIRDTRPMKLPEGSDYADTISSVVGFAELTQSHGKTVYPDGIQILNVFGSLKLAK